MKTLFGIFLSSDQSMFKCFLWGIRFLNTFSKKPDKLEYFKILKWLKFSLLQSLSSEYGFIYFPFQNKNGGSINTKPITSKKWFFKWEIIKTFIKKNFFDYKNIFFKKKILDYFLSSLWEIYGKFFSLLPKNLKNNPNYGENVIDWAQQNEKSFSLNTFKTSFFKRNIFIKMIKKYKLKYFQNYFQFIPEHINDLPNEEFFSRFFTILTSIFFIKNKTNSLLQPNKYFKTFQHINVDKKNSPKIKHLFLSFKHLDEYLFKKYIFSNSKIFAGQSYKHSWGIYLTHPCRMLSLVLEYRGIKIQSSLKNKVECSNRFRRQDLYFFQSTSQLTIDATFIGNKGRLVNHACVTNCFTRVIKHSNESFVFIISRKKIRILEEICYDYKINIDETDFNQIQCLCFEPGCKKELMI
jgi:hypothetical protein